MSKKSDKKAKELAQSNSKKAKDSLLNETMVDRSLMNRSGLVVNRQTPKAGEHPKTVLSQDRKQHGADGLGQPSILSMLFTKNAKKVMSPRSSRSWPGKPKNRMLVVLVGALIALGIGVGAIFGLSPESVDAAKRFLERSSDSSEEFLSDRVPAPTQPPSQASLKRSNYDESEGSNILDAVPVKKTPAANSDAKTKLSPSKPKAKLKERKAKSNKQSKAKAKTKTKTKTQGKAKSKTK